MDKKIVSVVVPVYNVEKYLKRCVNSILEQSYSKIEIILVDDGSKDASGELCDSFATKDERIRVIHKQNGGLASARNAGIIAASGEYICFVDSDDWIAQDTIQYCIDLIDKYGETVDIIEYDVIETDKYLFELRQPKEELKEMKGKDILQFLMFFSTKTDVYFSACRCLFRTSLIQSILFAEGKINEDISWKYRVFQASNHLIDSNQIKYFYYQSTGSITTAGLKKRDFDLYHAAEELVELSKIEEFGTIRHLAEVKKARTPLSLLCKIAFYGISDPELNENEVVTVLKKELQDNLKLLLSAPIPLSRKILAVMMSVSFKTTKCLIHLMKYVLVR